MEARVGIGRPTPCLQGENTPLPQVFQYTPALFDLTRFNPFTEDSTETIRAEKF